MREPYLERACRALWFTSADHSHPILPAQVPTSQVEMR